MVACLARHKKILLFTLFCSTLLVQKTDSTPQPIQQSMQPTILVTGGAGYIGSHTCLLLSQSGYNVIIIDKLLHRQTFNHPWATLIVDDFGNTELLEKLFTENKIAAVMHFAAHMEVGESVKNPLKFYDNNVTKTLRLLDAMKRYDVKTFIFSSSAAVYGTPLQLPLIESHPKNPVSPYGATKLMVEMILHDMQIAHGINYVCLRYFNAAGCLPGFGIGEHHEPETHVIPLLLRAAHNNKPFYLFGTNHATPDGSCVRDFLHVWDIAHAHLAALHYLERGGASDCFNLGTGNGVSVKELARAVEELTNCTLNMVHAPARAGDPAFLVADASKAYTQLNWQPHHSDLRNILQTALEFEHKKAD